MMLSTTRGRARPAIDHARRPEYWMPLAAAALLLLPAVAPALTVGAEFVGRADFSSYRQYSWIPGQPAADARVEATIREAVDRQLQRKGYRKVDRGGDFLVATEAMSDPVFTVGVLLVLIVDSQEERLIYRGRVGGLVKGPKDAQKKVSKAMKQVFKPFPRAPAP